MINVCRVDDIPNRIARALKLDEVAARFYHSFPGALQVTFPGQCYIVAYDPTRLGGANDHAAARQMDEAGNSLTPTQRPQLFARVESGTTDVMKPNNGNSCEGGFPGISAISAAK